MYPTFLHHVMLHYHWLWLCDCWWTRADMHSALCLYNAHCSKHRPFIAGTSTYMNNIWTALIGSPDTHSFRQTLWWLSHSNLGRVWKTWLCTIGSNHFWIRKQGNGLERYQSLDESDCVHCLPQLRHNEICSHQLGFNYILPCVVTVFQIQNKGSCVIVRCLHWASIVIAVLFFYEYPWNQVFHTSIKVLSLGSLCSVHGHYHHGSQQYNYAHQQHPGPDANPTLRPRFSIVDLGDLTSTSSRPIRKQCVASLFEYAIGRVAPGVSMGDIDKTPQGRAGSARLPRKPSTCLSAHFVRTFLLTGTGAMVETCPLQCTRAWTQGAVQSFRVAAVA